MPCFNPNHLVHPQPQRNRAARVRSQPYDHSPISLKSNSSGCRTRRTIRSRLLMMAITRTVGGRCQEGRSHST
eukprot:2847438-Pleurochrysis_carterae.AAC.2